MSGISCHEFERWLESGDPGALPGELLEHARSCARCAAMLARERALDALLAEALPVAAPARLTMAVMARLDAPAAAPVVRLVPSDPMPLAARIAMDPAVALSFALAAVCAWQGGRLLAWARVLGAEVGAGVPRLAGATHPWTLTLAFAPLVVLAALTLYRFSERLGAAAMPHPAGRL